MLTTKFSRAKRMAYHTFGTEMNVLVSSVQKDYLSTTEPFAKQLYFNHMMFQLM